jgi:argininosuccinate synthase
MPELQEQAAALVVLVEPVSVFARIVFSRGLFMDENKVTAQIATLVEQGKWVSKKLETLEKKVDELSAFKFKAVGAGTLIGMGIGLALDFFRGHK